jgi:hypothetical protein
MTVKRPKRLPWLSAAAAVFILLAVAAPIVEPFHAPAAPEDGVVLASWWATMFLGAWFLVSVTLWSIALHSRLPLAARFAARIALPGTRKLAETTLTVALMLAPAACTAGASEAPTLSLIARGVAAESSPMTSLPPITPTTAAPVSQTDPVELTDDVEPEVADPGGASLDEPSPFYEVQRGDNLWGIAESQLGAELGRVPSSAEVAPYWRELVNLNRGSLSSGEPDLIFPGELLSLPVGR